PTWVTEATEYLTGVFQDDEWLMCVEMWAEHEARLGYPDKRDKTHWINSAVRPEVFAEWLRKKRVYTWQPDIEDVAEYGEGWRKWWISLQPEWRCEDAETWPPLRVEGRESSWSKLRKGGANGLLTVLIALTWW
ncbi:hypothetical protein FA95DRAFT_1452982, partial [Auriscalpium vulgare]